MIRINTTISTEDIMDSIVENSHKDILKFLLEVDSSVQDYQFTADLIKELIKSLSEEFDCAAEPFNVSEILPDGFKVTSEGIIEKKDS